MPLNGNTKGDLWFSLPHGTGISHQNASLSQGRGEPQWQGRFTR